MGLAESLQEQEFSNTLVIKLQRGIPRIISTPTNFSPQELSEEIVIAALTRNNDLLILAEKEKRTIYGDELPAEYFRNRNDNPTIAVSRNPKGTHSPEGEPMTYWRMITHARKGESIAIYNAENDLYLPPTFDPLKEELEELQTPR